jgi:hypothetical protein
VCIDEQFAILGGFDEPEVRVQEIGEEEGKIVDELLFVVIRRIVRLHKVCFVSRGKW